MNMLHIADIDYTAFFLPAFPNQEDAKAFVNSVEAISADVSKAKIILHQAARMLWLADRIEEVAAGRPALQVLFYLIAAELVAKIVFKFDGEGESRRYVRRFFEEVCSDQQQAVLKRAFKKDGASLTLREAIDRLYDVRCDVVHEGMYFTFILPAHKGGTPMLTLTKEQGSVIAMMAIAELKQVVLEGAVLGARRLLTDARTNTV
jgi:hypothetical protein